MIVIRSAHSRARPLLVDHPPSSEDRSHSAIAADGLLRQCENFTEVRDGSHRERNQFGVERIGLG
jgi:hypothetical protein